MVRLNLFRSSCLSLLFVSTAFAAPGSAQQSPDFAGDWVLRVGNRVFLTVTLIPAPEDAGNFSGSLVRPQHFSTSDGASFTEVAGPPVRYPIVRSSTAENCLSFALQNPADKTGEDNLQLCIIGPGRGTLKFAALAAAGFELWPINREKGPPLVATDWDKQQTYHLDDSEMPNSEMQRIFEEDQKVRQPAVGKIDWGVVAKSDAARREATHKLLADGKLHTGADFERAAFVFQHGDTPDDYLLAHTLAMVAVSRGKSSAIWIASATLDRYLNSVHQPQIYGTQFYFQASEPTTQEPYNRNLIPDALRRFLGVPSQSAQEKQRKQYDAERSQP